MKTSVRHPAQLVALMLLAGGACTTILAFQNCAKNLDPSPPLIPPNLEPRGFAKSWDGNLYTIVVNSDVDGPAAQKIQASFRLTCRFVDTDDDRVVYESDDCGSLGAQSVTLDRGETWAQLPGIKAESIGLGTGVQYSVTLGLSFILESAGPKMTMPAFLFSL